MAADSLYTIGHSNHSLEALLALLTQHEIATLVDVRRFPGSRKHPQFNREHLASALTTVPIAYHWFEALGGRRGKQPAVPVDNSGLHNASFRNYADYMQTTTFAQSLEQLVRLAAPARLAIMCSEGLYWSCHRRLISDMLCARDVPVSHIMPNGQLRPHLLTPGVKIEHGAVSYPALERQIELPFSDSPQ